MLKIYQTQNVRVYEKLKNFLPKNTEIKRTENGKPYADGICFSLTHSGDTALFAISDKPIGIDAEIIKSRNFSSVVKRFTERERAEIDGSLTEFLRHWVIKEAYIKMLGGTLAHDLKKLEYFKGELFCNGEKTDCNIYHTVSDEIVYAVCAQCEIPQNIITEAI